MALSHSNTGWLAHYTVQHTVENYSGRGTYVRTQGEKRKTLPIQWQCSTLVRSFGLEFRWPAKEEIRERSFQLGRGLPLK